MKYRVFMEIDIDPDAPFIESDPSTMIDVLKEMFTDNFYDMEEVAIKDLVVEEYD